MPWYLAGPHDAITETQCFITARQNGVQIVRILKINFKHYKLNTSFHSKQMTRIPFLKESGSIYIHGDAAAQAALEGHDRNKSLY